MQASKRVNNTILRKDIEPLIGKGSTDEGEMRQAGQALFGKRFHGVYMADQIPKTLSKKRGFAVVNLDKERDKTNGSHWIAVSYEGPKSLLVYDSFGELHETPEQIGDLYPNSTTTNPDQDQKVDESNCGARCMAWLLMRSRWGKAVASEI